ncbi:peroxiredoxin-like family protein [Myroides odoratus]|uniref:peroxiredoxin-like family protein n=1 Tax=Myroides odoratus TaxID=256 RepID=UPI0039AFE47A
MNTLAQQIAELNENLAQQVPSEVLELFSRSIEELKIQNLEADTLAIGQPFPNFNLENASNERIELKELLQKGRVIVAFFRGNWCPYCSLELRALQNQLSQFMEKKVNLIAISPQLVPYNEAVKTNLQLDFEVLTDSNNLLAKQVGISFNLQDFVISTYQNLGIKLGDYNGNEANELPFPAVFVLDQNGIVTYKFVDSNYMNRIDIDELLQHI